MWKIAQKLSLEPIPGGLFSGVPIRKLVTEGNKLNIKFPTPKNLSLWIPSETIQEFSKEKEGFIFSMDSSIRSYSADTKIDTNIWKPFLVCNCGIETLPPSYSITEKFVKVHQKFKITGTSTGMFQLICQNWKVKFNDQYYTKNDILTINYGKKRPAPWPSYVNLIPEYVQTFVPVTKGSKVNVLIDDSKQKIEPPYPGSKIKLIGDTFFDHSFTTLGSPLTLYRYGVGAGLYSSEFLHLSSKMWNGQE